MLRKNSFLLLMLFSAHVALAQRLNIQVTAIDSQFLVHTSFKLLNGQPFPSNGLIVNTPDGILLIDAAWDERQTKQLLKWIKRNLKRKVFLCIITHAHDDRIGGIAVLLKKKIEVVSTPETARRAVALGFQSPSPAFNNDVHFGIGGKVDVRCFFPGQGHSPDNMVVWFPKNRVLFGGCLVKSTEATSLGNIADANLQEWPNTIRYLMEVCPSPLWVIPGHHGWLKPGALEHTLHLLEKHR